MLHQRSPDRWCSTNLKLSGAGLTAAKGTRDPRQMAPMSDSPPGERCVLFTRAADAIDSWQHIGGRGGVRRSTGEKCLLPSVSSTSALGVQRLRASGHKRA